VALAAQILGVRATVFMPEQAALPKIGATRGYGATVHLVGATIDESLAEARAFAERTGAVLVHPFDHVDVIAGQGTVGLEILADLSDVDTVLVPVGGGGLASGVATAVRSVAPQVAVLGVEPALAADAAESLAAGEVRVWPAERTYRTVADGLRTSLSALTLAHLRAHLAGIVTVTEEEILSAMRVLALSGRIVAEPSGAVTTAAYLFRREELPGGRTVAVVSGGNVEPALLARVLS